MIHNLKSAIQVLIRERRIILTCLALGHLAIAFFFEFAGRLTTPVHKNPDTVLFLLGENIDFTFFSSGVTAGGEIVLTVFGADTTHVIASYSLKANSTNQVSYPVYCSLTNFLLRSPKTQATDFFIQSIVEHERKKFPEARKIIVGLYKYRIPKPDAYRFKKVDQLIIEKKIFDL